MTNKLTPKSSLSLFSKFNISPCTETSRPAVGSSAIIIFGSSDIALATPTRRACPPLS